MGDDWAEAHHDVELMDSAGRRLAGVRVADGVAGIARLHELIAAQLGDRGGDDLEVLVGIETGRGPWVQALLAAGYRVFAVNPLSVARFRERHGVSGAKSDAADAHLLADMVRTDSHQLRPLAADTALAEAVKVVARKHKVLVWERTRHVLRLRRELLDYFPAAVEAFDGLTGGLAAPDVLDLLAQAPDPDSAAVLSRARIRTALSRAHRRGIEAKAARIQAVLRAEHLSQPGPVTQAYAATTRAEVAILAALAVQITALQSEVETCFGRHPDADIIVSQPGLGPILGARVLAEFGDDPHRYADAKSRKNYAGTSPITRASGKKRTVTARHVHNNWLIDALTGQAFSALTSSPGARAYYDQIRARGTSHQPALRQLANRLVGILHGCLKTHTPYNETTAWPQHHPQTNTAA